MIHPIIKNLNLKIGVDKSRENGTFSPANPTWLRTVNNVTCGEWGRIRTIFEQKTEYIYIPDLRNYSNV